MIGKTFYQRLEMDRLFKASMKRGQYFAVVGTQEKRLRNGTEAMSHKNGILPGMRAMNLMKRFFPSLGDQ